MSQVVLDSLNLHTEIGLVEPQKGTGPSARLTLVHNSRDVSSGGLPELGMGPGWSVSAFDWLDFGDPSAAVLHLGSGRKVSFQGSTSEPGFFLSLFQEATNRWTVRDRTGMERVFDFSNSSARGRLVTLRDPAGLELSVGYSPSGLLASLTEESGRSVTLSDTDQDGRIDRIVDGAPNGASFDLTYVGGELTTFSAVGSVSFHFGYEASGAISWLDDGSDDDGNGQTGRWAYSYDVEDRVLTVKDPEPYSTVQEFEHAMIAGEQRTRWTRRNGTVSDHFYDAAGRLVREVDPAGCAQIRSYDGNHQLLSLENEQGHEWKFVVNSAGRRTRITDPENLVFEASYDALGRLTSLDRTNGPVVGFRYEDPDYPLRISSAVLPPDGFGLPEAVTAIEYGDPGSGFDGQTESLTGPNGVVTTLGYDSGGVLERQELGAGHPNAVVSSYEFSPVGTRMADFGHVPSASSTTNPLLPPRPPGHSALVASPSRVASATSDDWGNIASWGAMIETGIQVPGSLPEPQEPLLRVFEHDYRGRLRSRVDLDAQPVQHLGWPAMQRSSSVVFHDAASASHPHGGATYTLSDGTLVDYFVDPVGRLERIEGTGKAPIRFEYEPDGRVSTRTHGEGPNQVRTRWEYRANNQVAAVTVEHSTDGGANWTAQRRMEIQYGAGGTITGRLEFDSGILVALTQYTHDARGQLIWEKRIGLHEYSRVYFYDQGGNRTSTYVLDSVDQVIEHRQHVYDVSAPSLFGSHSNRLMVEAHLDGQGNLLRTVWYDYEDTYGGVSEVVEKVEGDPWYRGTSLVYEDRDDGMFDSAVRLVLERRWQVDSGTGQAVSNEWLRAVELRQSDMLTRDGFIERDPDTLERVVLHPNTLWTDTTSPGAIDLDYIAPAGVLFPLTAYIAFVAETESSEESFLSGDEAENAHWRMNLSAGVIEDIALTAFGERVSGAAVAVDRYAGFSGLVGGESGLLPRGWVRIGARLYDPSTGRWLQSDPIGLGGGLNTYEYTQNSPVQQNDPTGLQAGGPVFTPIPGQTYRVRFGENPAFEYEWTEPGQLPIPYAPEVDFGGSPGGWPMPTTWFPWNANPSRVDRWRTRYRPSGGRGLRRSGLRPPLSFWF